MPFQLLILPKVLRGSKKQYIANLKRNGEADDSAKDIETDPFCKYGVVCIQCGFLIGCRIAWSGQKLVVYYFAVAFFNIDRVFTDKPVFVRVLQGCGAEPENRSRASFDHVCLLFVFLRCKPFSRYPGRLVLCDRYMQGASVFSVGYGWVLLDNFSRMDRCRSGDRIFRDAAAFKPKTSPAAFGRCKGVPPGAVFG